MILFNYFQTILETEPFYYKLIPILNTLFSISLGYFIAVYREWRKDNVELKKSMKYFFHCLYTLKEGVTYQIENYNQYIEGLEEKVNEIPLFKLDSGFNLTAISVVKTNDLYKIFIVKGSRKDVHFVTDMSNLLNSFEKIKSINVIFDNESNEFHKANERILTNFNSAIHDFDEKIRVYVLKHDKIGTTAIDNMIIDNINSIANAFNDIHTNPNLSIYQYMDGLILPIREIMYSRRNYDLSSEIKRMELAYTEFQHSRLNYINKVKQDLEHLRFIEKLYINLLKKNRKYINPLIVKADNIFS